MESKDKLERDDIKFLQLASYIENVSKKICKSSNLFKFNRKERELTKLSLGRMKSNLESQGTRVSLLIYFVIIIADKKHEFVYIIKGQLSYIRRII